MALTDKSSIVVPKGFYGNTSVLQGYNPQTESLVDLDVTRNTTATRINEQGLIENVAANVPRRDFLNGGCGELLLEPQRTNFITYSEEFDNADWEKNETNVTANASTAPDGTQTAYKVVEEAVSGTHRIKSNSIASSSGTYSASCFFKKGERDFAIIKLTDLSTGTVAGSFDLVNGTVSDQSSGSWTNTNVQIKDYGNGWFKGIVTGAQGAGSQIRLDLGISITGSTENYTGDGSSGIFMWGAQIEEGAKSTSYIPTTGSTVTRNKDLTAIDLSTEGVDEKYAVLFNVESDGGRLLMSSAGAGFDLDIKNSGRFAMLVDLNTITFKFPDNGQPQTELVYEKPADFRNIDFEAKLGPVRLDEVIWTEELQSSEYNAWLSGTVSSSFLETDWGAQTDFEDEFREEDWEYFPQLDVSSGTNFEFAWNNNQLTSLPQLDVSSGNNFRGAWRNNQLTSFPQLDLSNGTGFRDAWRSNQLTSFPQLDVSSGTDFRSAWQFNQLTSFPENMFDSLASPDNNCFETAWTGSNVIDAAGVENILVSIDTSGANAPASGVDIDISSNGDSLTSATNTAITSLKGKGWTITIDGVAQ